jgi:hypothetical protein
MKSLAISTAIIAASFDRFLLKKEKIGKLYATVFMIITQYKLVESSQHN